MKMPPTSTTQRPQHTNDMEDNSIDSVSTMPIHSLLNFVQAAR